MRYPFCSMLIWPCTKQKNKGKTVALFTRKNYIKMERKARIEKDLPIALVNKEFYLVYQPQIDTTTNKIIGAEALIRWKHRY